MEGKIKIIQIVGFYNEDQQEFTYLGAIIQDTEFVPEEYEHDDDIFYYFDSEEEVVGKHSDFTITSFKYV